MRKITLRNALQCGACLFITLTIAACGTLRSLQNAAINPPRAVVGDPLVFDGRRLLQEFSERRLQIQQAIGNASIEDVDTTGRVFRSSAVGANFSLTGTTDPSEIDFITSNRSAQVSQNTNTIELQNLYLNGLRDEQEARSALNSANLENAITKQALLKESADNYLVLTEFYRAQLAKESKEEERGEIIEKLAELQEDIDQVTLQTTSGTPSLPSFPSAISSTTTPTVGGSAPSKETLDGLLTGQLAENEQLKTILGANATIQSTRRQKFQQYQSYLDELYSYRNRYLLDDAHRSPGRRMVRLVFPVYVPPSRSSNVSRVEFRVKAVGNSSSREAVGSLLERAVLNDALNYFAGDQDDQARPLSFDERVRVTRRMYAVYERMMNTSEECTKRGSVKYSNSVVAKIISKEPFKNENSDAVNGTPSIMSGIETYSDLKEIIRTLADHEKRDEERYNTLKKKEYTYRDNVFEAWRLLNAAQKVGFEAVVSACLDPNLTHGWSEIESTNLSEIVKLESSDIIENEIDKIERKLSVYAMNPLIEREKVDQAVSRILSLGAFAGTNVGGSSAIGNASISAGLRNQLLAQSADVAPIIAANQYQKNQNDELRFGWTIYPRYTLRGGKALSRQHTGTSFYGSVDISLPTEVEKVSIETLSAGTSDGDYERINIDQITLPTLTYDELFANVTPFPTVTDTYEFGIVNAGEQFSFLINGFNLWKNPTVYIGGRPHDEIQFASGNENFLRARFSNLQGVSCDYLGKNYERQRSEYHDKPLNPDERCAARIWIHTSAGKDYVGSLVIEKSKNQKPKTKALTSEIISATRTNKNELVLVWNDVSAASYLNAVEKDKTKISVTDNPKRGKATSIELTVTDQKNIDKNTVQLTAEGQFKTNFCIKADGSDVDPLCQITLRLEDKSIILIAPVKIEPESKT